MSSCVLPQEYSDEWVNLDSEMVKEVHEANENRAGKADLLVAYRSAVVSIC